MNDTATIEQSPQAATAVIVQPDGSVVEMPLEDVRAALNAMYTEQNTQQPQQAEPQPQAQPRPIDAVAVDAGAEQGDVDMELVKSQIAGLGAAGLFGENSQEVAAAVLAQLEARHTEIDIHMETDSQEANLMAGATQENEVEVEAVAAQAEIGPHAARELQRQMANQMQQTTDQGFGGRS